jgi:hypothetical protein
MAGGEERIRMRAEVGKVDSGAVGQLAVYRKWLLPHDSLKNGYR